MISGGEISPAIRLMEEKTSPRNDELKAALKRSSEADPYDPALCLEVYSKAKEGILWIAVDAETLGMGEASNVLDADTDVQIAVTESPDGNPAFMAFSDEDELRARCPGAQGLALAARDVLLRARKSDFDGIVINPGSEWTHISPLHLDVILELGETPFETHCRRGTMYCELGAIELGIADLTKAHEIDPTDLVPLFNLMYAYYERGNVEAMHTVLTKVDPAQVGDPIQLRNYLALLYRSGIYKEGLPFAVRLRELDPDNPKALVLCGAISDKLERHQDAIEIFEHALSFDPASPVILTNLGIAYLGDDDLERAKELLTSSRGLDESYALTHYNLACVHARLEEVEEALEALRAAVALDSECLELVVNDEDLDPLRELSEFHEITQTH